MKNKYVMIGMIIFLMTFTVLFAQTDNLKSYRIYKMTEYLDLTPKQSEEFFPLLKKYEFRVAAISREEEKYYEKIKIRSHRKEISEIELDKVLQRVNAFENSRLQAKQDFIKRSRGVLNTEQVSRLPFFETEFRKNLKQEYIQRQKRQLQKPQNSGRFKPGNGSNGQGGSGPQGPG